MFRQFAELKLTFDGGTALTEVEVKELPSAEGPPVSAGDMERQRMTRLHAAFLTPPREEVRSSYFDAATGVMTDRIEFMTREFLVERARPEIRWQLGGEESLYRGYTVQKATAELDGQFIEAWFTMDIPISTGPGIYTGLPGAVLMVSVDRGETLIQAQEVTLGSEASMSIQAPTEGDRLSAEEFEGLVAEKMEEFRMQAAGRARGRHGGN